MSLSDRIKAGLKDLNVLTIPAKAHTAIAAGKVVQISLSTGVTSAPGDNDVAGLFGVAQEAVAKDAEGTFQIRGVCKMMTTGTGSAGEYVVPMSSMKVQKRATQTEAGAFAKLLEDAEDGSLKHTIITGQ